jgi:hypothetical protein
MNQWGEESPMRNEPGANPRFCPGCRRAALEEDSRLCAVCGDRLKPQGYCSICQDYWPLAVETPCPKHEVSLEEGAPRREHFLSGMTGQVPRWVTVGTFADAMEAEAPRIRLESEGIPTFLEGERMGSLSMYQVATGGVKLQVPQPLLADARILMRQSWSPVVEDDELDDAWDELAPNPGALRRSVMTWMILFILSAPLFMALLSLLMDAWS